MIEIVIAAIIGLGLVGAVCGACLATVIISLIRSHKIQIDHERGEESGKWIISYTPPQKED